MSRLSDELRLARVRDDYVVPPSGGREPRSPAAETWRYRLAMVLVMLVLGLLAVLLVRAASGAFGQDPGVDTSQPSAAAPLPPSAATAPR